MNNIKLSVDRLQVPENKTRRRKTVDNLQVCVEYISLVKEGDEEVKKIRGSYFHYPFNYSGKELGNGVMGNTFEKLVNRLSLYSTLDFDVSKSENVPSEKVDELIKCIREYWSK